MIEWSVYWSVWPFFREKEITKEFYLHQLQNQAKNVVNKVTFAASRLKTFERPALQTIRMAIDMIFSSFISGSVTYSRHCRRHIQIMSFSSHAFLKHFNKMLKFYSILWVICSFTERYAYWLELPNADRTECLSLDFTVCTRISICW